MSKTQVDIFGEIIVDNFAGGGGASTGIELAAGRPVAIAVNHDPDAILMHPTNHPHTEHYQASVWDIDPVEVCRGRKVGLAWFSPDCKHFSKAKGGKPVNKNIRGLAWIVLRWAAKVRPRVIMLENVEEFPKRLYGNDNRFEYDEEKDLYIIPEGWWEYRHYNPDDVYNCCVDDVVTHWMPLPEPPKEGGK